MTLVHPQDIDTSQDADSRPDRRLLLGYLHKTSNTLCGIKGYASLIAGRQNTGAEAGQWARKIILEVERMEEIFRSVGDLTRCRQHPDINVDLSGLVADTVSGWKEMNETAEVRVSSIPAGEIRLPAADLTLVLREILDNSVEGSTGTASAVKVEIYGGSWPGGRIFLEIVDNRGGMDTELAAQAADPFITTKDHHHGVGLTRVDTLMEMYGLHWSLVSTEGLGTRVLLEVAAEV